MPWSSGRPCVASSSKRSSAAAASGVPPARSFPPESGGRSGKPERSREPPSFISFSPFFSLPDDGRLATSRNTPTPGVSQEADVNRCRIHTGRSTAYFWQPGKTGNMERPIGVGADSSPVQSAVRIRPVPRGRLPVGPGTNVGQRKTGSAPARPC